jgi:hypothetical protein
MRPEPWRHWSAERTLTRPQGAVALVLLAVAVAVAIVFGPRPVAVVVIAAGTLVFTLTTVARLAYMWRGAQGPDAVDPADITDPGLPRYTVLVALYHEAEVVDALCEALARLEYPEDLLEVLLLVEHDDPDTARACELAQRPGWRVLVVPPGVPRTKPRALNHGLEHATGELLTIFDAEDRPDPDQLLKAVAELRRRPSEVAALQARLDFYNARQNHLTRWFACDYATHFGRYLEGIGRLGHPLPLGGTSTHFRTAVVREVGGWDAWNVTEDCELGMRLAAAGYRAETLASTTWEEAVPRLGTWVRQRSRWVKGFAQTGLAILRSPVATARAMGARRYLAALLTVGGAPVVLMLQLVSWALLGTYAALRLTGGDVGPIEAVFPEPLLSISIVLLLCGNFAILLAHVAEVYREGRYYLVAHAIALPLYWLLASIAAWRGVAQLVRRPHHWEKTQHGLAPAAPAVLPVTAGAGVSLAQPDGVLVATAVATTAAPTAVLVPPAPPPPPAVSTNGHPPPPDPPAAFARRARRLRFDPWLAGALALAAAALGAAVAFVAGRGELLGFGDTASHTVIARRVVEEGFRQIGTHWTPLFHVLEVPFVAVGPLYRSGAAGTIVSVAASVVTVFCVYRLALLLGRRRSLALAAAVLLVSSPNVLLAGVIPMQPATIMATTTAAVYMLALWAQSDGRTSLLVGAGLAFSAATLAHFDAWALLPLGIAAVVPVAYLRRRSRSEAGATLLVWLLSAGYGIVLFLVMNVLIYGTPTAFLRDGQIRFGHAPGSPLTPEHGVSGLTAYPVAAWYVAGPALAIAGIAGALIFAWRARREPSRLVALLLFYPLAWYTFQALATGSYIVPAAHLEDWIHLRYAIPIVPALALFAAVGLRNRVVVAAVTAAVLVSVVVMLDQNRVAGWLDLRQEDAAALSRQLDPGARWFAAHARDGGAWLPLSDPVNDRFELLTGADVERFIDTTDTRPWRRLRSRPGDAETLGVRWIVRVGKAPAGAFDAAVAATGAQRCFSKDQPVQAAVEIYAIGGSCPGAGGG